jgi:hypothetical protein
MSGTEPGVVRSNASESDTEVVGAYDSIDGTPMFVVADITGDRTWLAMASDAVIDVENHR